MSDTAAHLVDRVFPEVPVRQYVLSLPFALRTRLAFDQTLCSEVLRIFMRSVFTSLRRRARKTLTATWLHCGSMCFLQRSGGAINLNPHYHALVLDGAGDDTTLFPGGGEEGLEVLLHDAVEHAALRLAPLVLERIGHAARSAGVVGHGRELMRGACLG